MCAGIHSNRTFKSLKVNNYSWTSSALTFIFDVNSQFMMSWVFKIAVTNFNDDAHSEVRYLKHILKSKLFVFIIAEGFGLDL